MESIGEFLIGNRFYVTLRMISPEILFAHIELPISSEHLMHWSEKLCMLCSTMRSFYPLTSVVW